MKKVKNLICGLLAISVIFSYITVYASEPLAVQNSLTPVIRMLSSRASLQSGDIVASGYCGGEDDGTNLTWSLNSDGILTIFGNGVMKDYTAANGNTPNLWASLQKEHPIKKVIIQTGCTSIGTYAFYGVNFSEIDLPSSIRQIKTYACNSDELKQVVIPEGVEKIERYAFICSKLDKVYIPSTVISMSEETFRGCDMLDVIISENNPVYMSKDGVRFTKNMSILCEYRKALKQPIYVVPDGVEQIAPLAFSFSHIKTVYLPNSVDNIGDLCFWLSDLEEIHLGNAFSSISWNKFSCSNLDKIILDKAEGTFDLYDSNNKDLSRCIEYLRKLEIKNLECQIYSGKEILPARLYETRKDGTATTIIHPYYYEDIYTNNVDVGTATVEMRPKNRHGWGDDIIVKGEFSILPKEADTLKIEDIPNQTFTGLGIMPSVIITDDERSQ